MATQNDEKPSGETEEFLKVARERFALAEEAEAEFRKVANEDYAFRVGQQWPEEVKRDREQDSRPCLTINRLPQQIRQITNDQRQNRPAIKVYPVDDNADVDTAKIFQGLVRHIEYNSNADIAYDTAFDAAATGGLGYFRVISDYVDGMGFEQELLIKRVKDWRSVYLDPHAQEPDGSDANWGFIVDDIPKDEYKALFKDSELAKEADWNAVSESAQSWLTESSCRIAEYFYKDYQDIEIALVQMADGSSGVIELSGEEMQLPEGAQILQQRAYKKTIVKWAKINAVEILEETTVPGKYIPIIPIIGDEIYVNGKRILEGVIRHAKDSQRMYNYWASSETEAIALAPKAPFIVAEGQLKGHERKWAEANRRTHAYLEYNPTPKGYAGPGLPPPMRQTFEPAVQAITNARMQAADDIKSTTGIYDAALGARSNESSGIAIQRRANQAQTSNFHLIDNLSRALRHCGRILVDAIPQVYDTARAVRIIGEDGEQQVVRINEIFQKDGEQTIYDMSIGKYDVVVESGPSYATKRAEAVESMLALTKAYPQVAQVAGDLMVKNMDWPGAKEIAQRLKKTLPPGVAEPDPEQKEQQVPPEAQAQMAQMGQMIEQLTQSLNDANEKVNTKVLELESKERIALAQIEKEYNLKLADIGSAEALALLSHEIQQIGQRMDMLHVNEPIENEFDNGAEPDQQVPIEQPTGGVSPGLPNQME